MEKESDLNKTMREVQNNVKYLTLITPILALAVGVSTFLSYNFGRTGMGVWGFSLPMIYVIFTCATTIQKMKKWSFSKMSPDELQKNSKSLIIILALAIVSFIMVCLTIAYFVLNPFGV
jgi:hypothetical protein